MLDLVVSMELAGNGDRGLVMQVIILQENFCEATILADGCGDVHAALSAEAVRAQVKQAQGVVEGKGRVDGGRPVFLQFICLCSIDRSYAVVTQIQVEQRRVPTDCPENLLGVVSGGEEGNKRGNYTYLLR